ncbi:MAG: PAS domain-containing protein, partial [Phycisphaerae bacterium]|nr:PAS domain-containing protein [Phycisphaerae bacterium]
MRAGRPVIVVAICFGLLGWGLDAGLDYFLADQDGGSLWSAVVGSAPGIALYRRAGMVALLVGFAVIIMRLQGARGRREELSRPDGDREKGMGGASALTPIIEDSPFVAFLWGSADGRPVEFVTENVRRFGYEPEDFCSQRVRFLDLIHPDDRWRVVEEQKRAEQQGRDETVEVYRILTHAGEVRWVNDHTRFLRNGAGRITRLQGVLLDITDRRQEELQLLQSQKMEAVATLASGMAHDFNNLLTAIYGYTELARASLPEDHEAVEPLRMVEQAASQASGVTRSLLTFSRRHGSHKQPLNLVNMLTEAMRLLRHVLPASVDIVEDYRSEGDIWVRGDPMQLQQVLMNLALNARDAMPDGGRLRISLHRECEASGGGRSSVTGADGNGTVTLTVEDSGTGMSPDVQARVFEPFFTTKPRGQGSGLGLAVAHGVVTDCGGTVDVDSAVGRGTRVRIVLPCCEPGPDRVKSEEPREVVA